MVKPIRDPYAPDGLLARLRQALKAPTMSNDDIWDSEERLVKNAVRAHLLLPAYPDQKHPAGDYTQCRDIAIKAFYDYGKKLGDVEKIEWTLRFLKALAQEFAIVNEPGALGQKSLTVFDTPHHNATLPNGGGRFFQRPYHALNDHSVTSKFSVFIEQEIIPVAERHTEKTMSALFEIIELDRKDKLTGFLRETSWKAARGIFAYADRCSDPVRTLREILVPTLQALGHMYKSPDPDRGLEAAVELLSRIGDVKLAMKLALEVDENFHSTIHELAPHVLTNTAKSLAEMLQKPAPEGLARTFSSV